MTNDLSDLCSLSPSSGPEEWTNNRKKAPPARTSKGVYREQPYSRFWPATVLHVPSQVMDFLWTLFPFFTNKINQNDKNSWLVKLSFSGTDSVVTWTTPTNGTLRITGLCSLNQRTNQNSNRPTHVRGRRALAVRGGVIWGVRCFHLAGQFL